MPHYVNFSVLDYSEETSQTKVNFGAVTAISIAGLLTQIGALRTAFSNIILGVISREQWVGDSTALTNIPPADTAAQNELKWQFSYEGNTSKKKFRLELPAADTSFLIPGTDNADLTATEMAAAITALEAIGRSPDDDQETINVLGVKLVGRNI